jgi:hypothetical protein
MWPERPKEPCTRGCGTPKTERNRYFTGKYMTARDFRGEQEYFLSRHRLHNRVLHGWGIVCGLRVVRHPDPDCSSRWVVVRAGIAIDCCGRELVLLKDQIKELPLPRNEPAEARDEEVMTGPFLLCLRYDEIPVEHVPALYTEGDCDPAREEANRVREEASLIFRSLDKVEPGCWPEPSRDKERHCRDDCDDELPGPAGICLKPDCPCGKIVPLALIDFDPKNPDAGFTIDREGRHELPLPREFFTRIVGMNWPHGGELSLNDLREMNGRLEVRFDRQLQPSTSPKSGINEYTMTVQYAEAQRQLEFLPRDPKVRPKLENSCTAVYTMDLDNLPRGIVGSDVYVTLYCDFVLDCHGNPVDGNHWKGRLPPSGNGVRGGVFRSWFRIIGRDPTARLGLSVSGPAAAEPGETVRLNLKILNMGAVDLHDVGLEDLDRNAIEDGLSLPAGGPPCSVPYDLKVPYEATNPFAVRIQAQGEDINNDKAYDTCQHIIRLEGAPRAISLTKSLKDRQAFSDEVSYEIRIQNHSSEPLEDIHVVDRYQVLDGDLKAVSSEPRGWHNEARRRLTWDWERLEARETQTITVTMQVEPHEYEATITNRAKVSATAPNSQRVTDSHTLSSSTTRPEMTTGAPTYSAS